MRRLVGNTFALVQSGELSAELAAQKLLKSGVPVAVIGRVLEMAVSNQRSAAMPATVATSAQVTRLASTSALTLAA